MELKEDYLAVIIAFVVGVLLTYFFLRGSSSTQNVERWEWIDRKGRKREIVVHREVKEGG